MLNLLIRVRADIYARVSARLQFIGNRYDIVHEMDISYVSVWRYRVLNE